MSPAEIRPKMNELLKKAQEIDKNARIEFDERKFFSHKEGIFTLTLTFKNFGLGDLLEEAKS
jgi:hypothetical protein